MRRFAWVLKRFDQAWKSQINQIALYEFKKGRVIFVIINLVSLDKTIKEVEDSDSLGNYSGVDGHQSVKYLQALCG